VQESAKPNRRRARRSAQPLGGMATKSLRRSQVVEAFLDDIADCPEFMGLPRPGVNSVGGFGNSPLKIAAVRGDVAAIEALVHAGADLNALNEHGSTALHHAVAQGHYSAASRLVELGARVNIRDQLGHLPADNARTPELKALFSVRRQ
jgi:ankyrin repeat protein